MRQSQELLLRIAAMLTAMVLRLNESGSGARSGSRSADYRKRTSRTQGTLR